MTTASSSSPPDASSLSPGVLSTLSVNSTDSTPVAKGAGIGGSSAERSDRSTAGASGAAGLLVDPPGRRAAESRAAGAGGPADRNGSSPTAGTNSSADRSVGAELPIQQVQKRQGGGNTEGGVNISPSAVCKLADDMEAKRGAVDALKATLEELKADEEVASKEWDRSKKDQVEKEYMETEAGKRLASLRVLSEKLPNDPRVKDTRFQKKLAKEEARLNVHLQTANEELNRIRAEIVAVEEDLKVAEDDVEAAKLIQDELIQRLLSGISSDEESSDEDEEEEVVGSRASDGGGVNINPPKTASVGVLPPEELYLYNNKTPLGVITEFYQCLVQEGRMTEDEKNKKLVKRRNDLETYKGSEVAMLRILAGQYDKDWSTLGVSSRHLLASTYREFDDKKLAELDSILDGAADLIFADLVLEHRFDPAKFGMSAVPKHDALALDMMDEADAKAKRSLSALGKLTLEQQEPLVKLFASKKYSFLHRAVRIHRDKQEVTEVGALALMEEAEKAVKKGLSFIRGLSTVKQAQLLKQFASKEYPFLYEAVDAHVTNLEAICGRKESMQGGGSPDSIHTDAAVRGQGSPGTYDAHDSAIGRAYTTSLSNGENFLLPEVDLTVTRSDLLALQKILLDLSDGKIKSYDDLVLLGAKSSIPENRRQEMISDDDIISMLKKLAKMKFEKSAQYILTMTHNNLNAFQFPIITVKSFYGDGTVRRANFRAWFKAMFFGGSEATVGGRPKQIPRKFENDSTLVDKYWGELDGSKRVPKAIFFM